MRMFILLLLLSSAVWAQSYYMNVKMKDGTTKPYPISSIQKLTFYPTVGVQDLDKFKNALKTFTLLQNYPNPFNPTTTISYTIPKAGNVELKIFDINGQLVRSLVKEQKEVGVYKANWDSKNDADRTVASGVYICQVKYNNSLLAKKMLLLK
ncbi:MAG: T9SS type A sorting domain-containing protein [Ignavibacteriales bacterium]|nr:T9SS type A sorting domain-containing protein [Ignavibacteriales bacterium]